MARKLFPAFSLVLALVLAGARVEAGAIHVPGDSPTIQGGIGMAGAGDSVLVAAGTYPEHVSLASNVAVIGAGAATTIIDGGGVAIDVVRAVSVANARLQRFTVRGAVSGGGLPGGAGVFVNFPSSLVVIEDVIATGNDFGIAVFNAYSRTGPQIRGCLVHGNNFFGISDPGNGDVAGCVIHGNLDGIFISGNSAAPRIDRDTIWGNSRDGLNYWNDFAPTVTNSIFARNGGYGIHERAPGTFVDPIVRFDLFWQNAAGNYFDVQTGLARNTAAEINAMPNCSNNLVDDPLLCAPPADFHLCADSPAIGAGQGGVTIGALGAGCGPCGIAAVVAAEAPPRALRLAARPNPFAPSTAVSFELETPGHATLRVYDANGRVVRTLADRDLAAGPWRFEWDGRTERGERAPAGIYLVDLRAGGVEITRKVTRLNE